MILYFRLRLYTDLSSFDFVLKFFLSTLIFKVTEGETEISIKYAKVWSKQSLLV